MGSRIETRRDNRIPVTYKVQMDFLDNCLDIAKKEGCKPTSKIPLSSLVALRDEVQSQVDARPAAESPFRKFLQFMGFRDDVTTMLTVLNRGIEDVTKVDSEWFHYQDFSFYDMVRESKWPWMRNPLSVVTVVIFFLYLFTPILFCLIAYDKNICPADPSGKNRSYYGWMTSLYFASVTMSTVGYGDVSVDLDARWHVLLGVLYMIIALVVVVLAFSAAADEAFSGFASINERAVSFFTGNLLEGKLLHQQIRRVATVKLFEIIFQFTLLNLIGLFAARLFIRFSGDEEAQWTWMTTFYWAVQTTTTIGKQTSALARLRLSLSLS